MNEQITVLTSKTTHQILAAVTRVADPTTELSPENLAHPAFLLRHFDTSNSLSFEIDPKDLAVDVVGEDLDIIQGVLADPLAYFLRRPERGEPKIEPILGSAPPAPGTIELNIDEANIVPSQGTVPVEVPYDHVEKAEKVPVWGQVERGQLTSPLTAQATAQFDVSNPVSATVVLHFDQTFPPGDYRFLVLATKREPHVEAHQVI